MNSELIEEKKIDDINESFITKINFFRALKKIATSDNSEV